MAGTSKQTGSSGRIDGGRDVPSVYLDGDVVMIQCDFSTTGLKAPSNRTRHSESVLDRLLTDSADSE
jgi:hypothetical protein